MRKNVILFIDTSQMNTTRVGVEIDGKRFEKVTVARVATSQQTLPLIEELLKSHKRTICDITNINAATGPGSFTGLRVGLSIANMLGKLLNIPVNKNKTIATPTYS